MTLFFSLSRPWILPRSLFLFLGMLLAANFAQSAEAPFTRPIPAIPQAVPKEIPAETISDCPSFDQLQSTQSFKSLACQLSVQAGVPFDGQIATIRWCGPDRVDSIGPEGDVRTTGPINDYGHPNITHEIFEIYYLRRGGGEKNPDDFSWDQKEHLYGHHTWKEVGQYSIAGQAHVWCNHNGIKELTGPVFNIPSVTVTEPGVPNAIQPTNGSQVSSGRKYENFGKVILEAKAPASGTMVMLTTSNRAVIEVQTNLGTTGDPDPETGMKYPSIYAYVPPGQDTVPFNILVAGDGAGKQASLTVKCVGNYSFISPCRKLAETPIALTVKVAP